MRTKTLEVKENVYEKKTILNSSSSFLTKQNQTVHEGAHKSVQPISITCFSIADARKN